jgi:Rrf2 family nitric oxide-sensitive transcriptional repressor
MVEHKLDMFIQMSIFSQTVEYALRAAVWLADHGDTPLTTRQIAKGTQVPAGYLSKVLQALGRAGLVHAQRGKHGGFTLAKHPADISVLEVVNAVDPIRRIRHCPLGLKAHRHRLCPLHRSLDSAMQLIEQSFARTRLADVSESLETHQPDVALHA